MGHCLVYNSRDVKQNEANAESLLWDRLRDKSFSGLQFSRKQKIGRYIVDFVCFERNIVIEISGWQCEENPEVWTRTDWLNREGFSVVRFRNYEIILNINGVLEEIRNHL